MRGQRATAVRLAGLLLAFVVPAAPLPAQRIGPLPQRLTSVPARIYEPLEAPDTDPFGYPRNDIDRTHFTTLLAAGRYEALEAELSALEAAVRADVRHEMRLSSAYHAFDRADAPMGEMLDAWVDTKPSSVEARLARGRYRLARARELRGRNLLLETRPDQNEGVRRWADLASEDLNVVFAGSPDHPAGFELGLDVMQLGGWSGEIVALLDHALASYPLSARLPASALASATPAAGGSYGIMDGLAAAAAARADANPRLAPLRGYANAERGRQALERQDLPAAVHWYTLALETGQDPLFLTGRGRAWLAAKDYTRALLDLLDAAAQTPQDPENLDARARGLLEIAQFAPPDIRDLVLDRAFETVTTLKAVDPARPDVDRLVSWITEVRAGCRARSPQCGGQDDA